MSSFYLLHQVGKVASQTLEARIRRATGNSGRVERHHFLSEHGLAHLEAICNLPGIERDGADSVMQQVAVARSVRQDIMRREPGRIDVITGIREPLKLAIAAFFQNLPIYCPWVDYNPDASVKMAAALIEFFKDQFDRMLLRKPASTFQEALLDLKLRGPEPWFEQEFKAFYGIDVHDLPMSGTDPFVTFKDGRFRFLLYRTEHLPSAIVGLLEAIGLPGGGSLENVNVGAAKGYTHLYSAFLAHFETTSSMEDYYLGSRFYKKFYDRTSR